MLYKVWNGARTARKIVFADSLQDVIVKGKLLDLTLTYSDFARAETPNCCQNIAY